MTSHPFDLQRENESIGKKVTAMDGLFWRVWQHCKLSVAICRWCVQSISITVPIFSLSQSLPLTFHKKKYHEYFHSCLVVCLYWCLACTLTGQCWNPLRWTWRAECYGNKDESGFFSWNVVIWGWLLTKKSGVAKKGKLFSNISKGETFLFRRIYSL